MMIFRDEIHFLINLKTIKAKLYIYWNHENNNNPASALLYLGFPLYQELG